MKAVKLVALFLFANAICGCNTVLCGHLGEEWQTLKSRAEQKFSMEFEIENIPCEFYYINIRARGNSIDSGSLKALHDELYDSMKRVGWPNFAVYDQNGNYLFHDVNTGVRYRR